MHIGLNQKTLRELKNGIVNSGKLVRMGFDQHKWSQGGLRECKQLDWKNMQWLPNMWGFKRQALQAYSTSKKERKWLMFANLTILMWYKPTKYIWLVVSTPLKNSSSQLLGKIKHVPNHQPVYVWLILLYAQSRHQILPVVWTTAPTFRFSCKILALSGSLPAFLAMDGEQRTDWVPKKLENPISMEDFPAGYVWSIDYQYRRVNSPD